MNKKNLNYIAFKTIFIKEYLRFMRIWVQTLIPPVITVVLYLLIFGTLIGSQIGDINGFSYIEFIIPGLILMALITNSYSNVSSSFFQAKMMKYIEELFISPTNNNIIILGYISGGILRGLIISVLLFLVSLFFTSMNIFNIFVIISSLFLTSILFSLAGLINGIYAKKFDDVTIIPTFILTPMTYLGGIFYSIKQIPEFFQYISYANPILYLINVFRYGFTGMSDVPIWITYLMTIIFIIIAYIIAFKLLKKGYGIKN